MAEPELSGREIVRRGPWTNFGKYIGRTAYLSDGRTTTELQHRVVMAELVGRPLLTEEHVHHKDHDGHNNDPSNLELLTRREHGLEHGADLRKRLTLVCLRCSASFERKGNNERGNRKKGKTGPFCGKSCAGKWSRERQLEAKHAAE